MAKHNISLLIVMVVALMVFVVTMAFSALAAAGTNPFLYSTSNISDEFVTQITPSGWTFTIWTIIYLFLASVMVYVISGIFRKNANGYVYCSPAVLPHGFFVTWSLNLLLNLGWLLLWDRKLMNAALVVLFLIASTNYILISVSCQGLSTYGAWLQKYHKVDLWLHRLLIQNGLAIYTMWTTIAFLVNLTIVLTYSAEPSSSDAATISLALLTVVVVVWFLVENFVLEKHMRFVLTVYPVVIWALTGVFTENYNRAAPSRNNVFVAVLLGISCLLFATRILLVTWRQIKHPLYRNVNPDAMPQTEIDIKPRKSYLLMHDLCRCLYSLCLCIYSCYICFSGCQ